MTDKPDAVEQWEERVALELTEKYARASVLPIIGDAFKYAYKRGAENAPWGPDHLAPFADALIRWARESFVEQKVIVRASRRGEAGAARTTGGQQ